jgi:hypothetical protein
MNYLRSLLTVGVVFGCLLLSGGAATAQDEQPNVSGRRARATAAVKLREGPPRRGLVFIKGPGEKIAEIPKDEVVEILDQLPVPTVAGDSFWVKVRKADSSGKPVVGWVYWGTERGESVNFKIENEER